MSAKLKLQLRKLGIITITWMLLGLYLAFNEHLTLQSGWSIGPNETYSLISAVLFSLGAAFMGALLGGSVLVFVVNERFREKPYSYGIITIVIAFVLIVSLITVVIGLIMVPMNTGLPLSHPLSQKALWEFFRNPIHLKNSLSWSIIVGMTQLLLQVSDKFGPGLWWDFIRGKYHSPSSEKRIFMCVDIKSSTTLAEKLGNEKYYCLLRDFFADITDSILLNKGEVYQYVGDEIIVSWKMEQGIENNHCLRCYFDMQKAINGKQEKYTERYGLVPRFKAGLHYGEVTAGEIGIIKRDLTFSGDVLNTTARIQGECNAHEVSILSSNRLLELLSPKNFRSIGIGAIPLRGKRTEVELSTVEWIG